MFLSFILLFIQLVAFPERSDGILDKHAKDGELSFAASGSLGFYYSGRCHKTYPNMTVGPDDQKADWCSNIGQGNANQPWISVHLNHKKMKVIGYAVRSGCCYYSCCCTDDDSIIDDGCCCGLYSFALQGSNDNTTWKTIHTVDQDNEIWACVNRSYQLNSPVEFEFFRLFLLKPRPYCANCMAINKFELYGEESQSFDSYENEDDNDESVSIIGKVIKDNEQ